MSKFLAIKVDEGTDEMRKGKSYTVTKELILAAPEFDTREEANNYCDLINPDFLWVIMLVDEELSKQQWWSSRS
jgi:hypothetical protein